LSKFIPDFDNLEKCFDRGQTIFSDCNLQNKKIKSNFSLFEVGYKTNCIFLISESFFYFQVQLTFP